MQSILKELWYGNLAPNDNRIISKEERKLMKSVSDSYDALLPLLDEKQKEVFEEFEETYSALRDKEEDETFVYAFKLGARTIIEILLSDTTGV